jgi:hypothetical protein
VFFWIVNRDINNLHVVNMRCGHDPGPQGWRAEATSATDENNVVARAATASEVRRLQNEKGIDESELVNV